MPQKIRSVHVTVVLESGEKVAFYALPSPMTFKADDPPTPIDLFRHEQWITVKMSQREDEIPLAMETPTTRQETRIVYVLEITALQMKAQGLEKLR